MRVFRHAAGAHADRRHTVVVQGGRVVPRNKQAGQHVGFAVVARLPAYQQILIEPSPQQVVAVAADQHVTPEAALQLVVADVAQQDAAAIAGIQDVVPAAALPDPAANPKRRRLPKS